MVEEAEPGDSNDSKMKDRRWCTINWSYMPIKAHYFILFAGMGGTTPYMQVIAKDFGIRPTAVGIIYTIIPLCVCLSKPTFGFLTDKLQNIKAVLLVLLIVTALTFYGILLIPPIKDSKVGSIKVTAACKDYQRELTIMPPIYRSNCAKEISNKQFDCKFTSNCFKNKSLDTFLKVKDILTGNENTTLDFSLVIRHREINKQDCDCLKYEISNMTCETSFYKCDSFQKNDYFLDYSMYNFWAFALLAIISGTASVTAICLTDAACNEILSDEAKQYGKQRLWASVSWGLATLLTGYLNDVATRNSNYANYSPGFYLMLVFVAADVVLVCNLRLEKANNSKNICKDVGKIFSSFKTILFSIGVYISGALAGLLWTYEFWYLTELGSSQLLLGLVAGVQCLIAEVPLFFLSGWFIKHFGHFYCMIASLVAFGLRIGSYSLLQNPWFVLPIDVLHGVTFAVMMSAMTLYAADFAPPGTEATMLGIFGGIYEGLGVATGSFLGGIGFEYIGGQGTFNIASLISLCCVPLFIVAHKILSRSEGSFNFDEKSTTSNRDVQSSQTKNGF